MWNVVVYQMDVDINLRFHEPACTGSRYDVYSVMVHKHRKCLCTITDKGYVGFHKRLLYFPSSYSQSTFPSNSLPVTRSLSLQDIRLGVWVSVRVCVCKNLFVCLFMCVCVVCV